MQLIKITQLWQCLRHKQTPWNIKIRNKQFSFQKHGNNRYPYLLLDLGRSMRVTKVSVLGGIDSFKNPLMNLDVRVGNYSAVGHDAYSIITYNTRFLYFQQH